MKTDPKFFDRKSIRLKGYDYSQPGAYFLTIVSQNRLELFGKITDDVVHLSDAGRMVELEWSHLSNRFGQIQLDQFVVMPNHFHAILFIIEDTHLNVRKDVNPVEGEIDDHEKTDRVSLGDVIGAFKSITTHEYIRCASIWLGFVCRPVVAT